MCAIPRRASRRPTSLSQAARAPMSREGRRLPDRLPDRGECQPCEKIHGRISYRRSCHSRGGSPPALTHPRTQSRARCLSCAGSMSSTRDPYAGIGTIGTSVAHPLRRELEQIEGIGLTRGDPEGSPARSRDVPGPRPLRGLAMVAIREPLDAEKVSRRLAPMPSMPGPPKGGHLG